MKNFFYWFYIVFVYKNVRLTQLFEKLVRSLRRWFLHEGSSVRDKAKSFRFGTTVAISWTSTNKIHAKISKWRKFFEKKTFFFNVFAKNKTVKNLLFKVLYLPDIFVCKNCVKSIRKMFSRILGIYLLSPTSFV